MNATLELPEHLKSPPPRAWVLGLIFILALSFSLINLAYYTYLATRWPSGPWGAIIFLDLALLAMGLGGLWWGDTVKGESAAVCPLLGLTLVAGAIFFLLAPLFLASLPLERWPNQGWLGYFGHQIWLALLILIPGFFLWGAAAPFLTALAFPQDKGLATGVFSLCGLTLLALALGALGSCWWPAQPSIWLERLIGLPSLPILIVGLWLWFKTPVEDRQELPLWPNASLGLWSGDRSYGLDILCSPRRAKTLTPALFLGALAATLAATTWLYLSLSADQMALWPLWPLLLIALIVGALLLGPLLAALTAPMTALAIDLLFLTLIIAFWPRPPATNVLSWLGLGATLVTLGALWPLAARVSLIRYGYIPSGLGHINFWLMGGLLTGLTLATALLGHSTNLANLVYRLAFIGSTLALAISWSWLWGLIASVVLITWHFLSWS
ncbi:MAG: hypothetical protein LBT86_08505 [Deltaproteobacteria bacterium]|jgi:hypothetical protein|nr:hypothetical protein [Deltaproteobacteria bacterium]